MVSIAATITECLVALTLFLLLLIFSFYEGKQRSGSHCSGSSGAAMLIRMVFIPH
jgi:hypothetical protein